MKKCTEEEYREQTHREFAALSLDMKEWKAEQERMKEKQQEGQREGAKARKRRERGAEIPERCRQWYPRQKLQVVT